MVQEREEYSSGTPEGEGAILPFPRCPRTQCPVALSLRV